MFACYAISKLSLQLDRQPVEGVGARVEGA